jgi:hypothetical protein
VQTVLSIRWFRALATDQAPVNTDEGVLPLLLAHAVMHNRLNSNSCSHTHSSLELLDCTLPLLKGQPACLLLSRTAVACRSPTGANGRCQETYSIAVDTHNHDMQPRTLCFPILCTMKLTSTREQELAKRNTPTLVFSNVGNSTSATCTHTTAFNPSQCYNQQHITRAACCQEPC